MKIAIEMIHVDGTVIVDAKLLSAFIEQGLPGSEMGQKISKFVMNHFRAGDNLCSLRFEFQFCDK